MAMMSNKALIGYATSILLNGIAFVILSFNFNSKLAEEEVFNHDSVEGMTNECNLLQHDLEFNTAKQTGLVTSLDRLEKLSHTALVMGSSVNEQEARAIWSARR